MRKRIQIRPPVPETPAPAEPPADALSVGEFTRRVKEVLERTFSRVRVHGEVFGLSRPASGHLYFTLKDPEDGAAAQVAVVIWRDRAGRLRFPLEDGLRLVVEGRVAVYEPRGAYQIIADAVLPAGQGTLLVAFERLKERLWKEGLFDPARKRPLPFLPRAIALITSPSGAAVHDVLRSIYRKFPARVRLLPVRVQGEGAADEIVAAFDFLRRHPEVCDLAIIARGGGSLEDLWSFNEEKVARAVAAAAVPVISGVGHQVDVTLCDLAADARAQTPTHAGELAVPDRLELLRALEDSRRRAREALIRRLEDCRREAASLRDRLQVGGPGRLLNRERELATALASAFKKCLYNRLRQWQDLFSLQVEKLGALNPLDVLQRGFSMTLNARGEVVRSASGLEAGAGLVILLAEGEIDAQVLAIRSLKSRCRMELGEDFWNSLRGLRLPANPGPLPRSS